MEFSSARKCDEPGAIIVTQPGSRCMNNLAQTLAHEFDGPIGLLDPDKPLWRIRMGVPAEQFPSPEAALAAARSSGLVAHGRVMIWRPEAPRGPVWLGLPAALVSEPSIPVAHNILVGLIGFASSPQMDQAHLWAPPCPDAALRAWGQAVADRLRAEALWLNPQGAENLGGEDQPSLFDQLSRRLRVSDAPERFQRLATSALRVALGLEAVAWVPSNPREPLIVAGEVAGLEHEQFRTLLPDGFGSTIRIVNRSAPARDCQARIERLAIVGSDLEGSAGWLLAINPIDGRAMGAAEIKILQPIAGLISIQRTNARLYAEVKELVFGVVRSLTAAIDAKDPYTSGHSERVARIAVRLGEELGLTPTQRGDLYLMGLLHDVGKIGIDDSVLKKTGPLTADEFRQIQSHVTIGVHILSDIKKLHHLLPGVAHHHESLDGTGYPSGLAGDEIPLPARILAVADAFDAMSSKRPYRCRLTHAQIGEVFRRGAGTQWDAAVVEALYACRADLERIRQKGLGDSLQQVVSETLGRG